MTDLSDRTARSPSVDAPFLLALVDLSPDGMALLEGSSPREATITWTNASFDRLVLPAGGSAVGRSVLELVPVGDEAADPANDAATAITEATRWGDALVRGRDGAVVARMRPVPTPPGRSAPDQPRWALVASSTTATGVADEALRASEERFRALAANAPMGVFFSEVGLRLGYVNERFSALWGQPAAAVLGMGWLDSVHEGDTAVLVDALSAVQAAVRQPVTLEGTDIVISASVGVVVADGDHSAEGLLRDADVAMYQAKQVGKARYAVFDPRVREGLRDRLSLSADLRRAVAGGEIGVVYHPVWDVRGTTPVAVGLEALVRWDHPVRGSVPATQIITLADEHGLLDELGALIVRRACTDLARWHREVPGASQLGVGVNLCTSQLRDNGLVDQIATTLADAGLSPAYQWLELTETVVAEDIDTSAHVLDDLRALGVRLVVDDFGTGYSSLAYLHRLPVQGVKIDRRFVGRLEESASDAAIVAAIVAMADALGLTATAEGVERPGQLAELQRLGCAQAQGYLLSRPVSAAEVPAALSRPVLPSSRPLGPRRTPAPSAP